MTLHEAIQRVLMTTDEPLSNYELARVINANSWYQRKDGKEVTPSQIAARINQYPDIFKIENQQVALVDKATLAFKNEYFHILNRLESGKLLRMEAKEIALISLFMVWSENTAFDSQHVDEYELLSQAISSALFFLDEGTMAHARSLLRKLSKSEAHFLANELLQFKSHKKPSHEIFGPFYDDIANDYSNTSSSNSGEFSSPKTLSSFISSISKGYERGIILDPFAGMGGSLIRTVKNSTNSRQGIIANDINQSACLIGSLNLAANGFMDFKFSNGDFLQMTFPNDFADLVVTVPPFGIKSKKYFDDLNWQLLEAFSIEFGFKSYDHVDSLVASILSIILCLKKGGRAIVVVPDGILFSGKRDFTSIREFLVKRKLLKGVISLPSSIFRPHMGISSSVLIIDNEQINQEDKLFLFDGSRYSNEGFERESEKIIDAFKTQKDIENAVLIKYESIPFKNFDLSPKRYLLESLTSADHICISELVESIYTGIVIAKSNINRNTGIPFIQVGDLIDARGINEIDSTNAEYFITDEELVSKRIRFIPDHSVLVAKVGSKLKPTLYKHVDFTLCNPNIIVIKTNESKLLPEYLITQLQSDYVLKQVEAIRHNIGVPHFSKSDFLNIKIKIRSVEEQRSYTSTFYGKQLVEVKAITDQQREDDLYNVIASLKHELKQPVSSLGMDLNSLIDFIKVKAEKGETFHLEDTIVELLPGQTVADAKESILENVLKRMASAVFTAQNTLGKTEEILNVGAGVFVPEPVLIKKFLSGVIKPIFANNNCLINIIGEENEIVVDKYQIEILFKRLIENAIKHGFNKDGPKEDNIINIRVSNKNAYRDFNEIIVENNGLPFSADFNISKFQMIGQTVNRYKGTGFGGFHIKRIIESHKGEIYLADKKEVGESQFKVRFKIYLP